MKPRAESPRDKASKSVATKPTQSANDRLAAKTAVLHEGPGNSYLVIARLSRPTRVVVIGVTPHWAHIALPASRIEGWIPRTLLS